MRKRHQFPVPPCPACVDEPWVVLATVTTPTGGAPKIVVSYDDRRTLLATQRLQVAMLCLP